MEVTHTQKKKEVTATHDDAFLVDVALISAALAPVHFDASIRLSVIKIRKKPSKVAVKWKDTNCYNAF